MVSDRHSGQVTVATPERPPPQLIKCPNVVLPSILDKFAHSLAGKQ
jgi:hypothetical protein